MTSVIDRHGMEGENELYQLSNLKGGSTGSAHNFKCTTTGTTTTTSGFL